MGFFQKIRDAIGGGGKTPSRPVDVRAETAIARLRLWPAVVASKPEIVVLITPWLGSAIPFWSVEAACMLRAASHRVTMAWDDADLAGDTSVPSGRAAVQRLVEAAARTFDAVHFDPASGGAPDLEDLKLAEQLARDNAAWKMRGESSAPPSLELRPQFMPAIARHLTAVRAWLARRRPFFLLVPGDARGASDVWLNAARRIGVPVTSFHSAHGQVSVTHSSGVDAPADGDDAVARIKAGTPSEELERCVNEARAGMSGADATEDAALRAYVSEQCSRVNTKFTTDPADFSRWIDTPPADFWAQPELEDLREALLTRTPLAVLRHRRFARSR